MLGSVEHKSKYYIFSANSYLKEYKSHLESPEGKIIL
uniref:Uncharacterized protein n=1 Tax=Anguilla anguilla TaxID=7936 RepID=A0A0E9R2I6_ANGAN